MQGRFAPKKHAFRQVRTSAVRSALVVLVLGLCVGASGPPVIIYTALQPWGKFPIKSTLVGYFLVTRLGICVVQAGSGLITPEVLILFITGLPALVVGVSAGSYLFNRVDSNSYRKALNIMLIILGVFMMVRAVAN